MLTVITISKNNSNGLKRTLNSLIDQCCFAEIELIVVDGNSSDGSNRTINEFKKKKHNITLVNDRGNGIYEAMNMGLSEVKAGFVCFLNAGDVLVETDIISQILFHLRKKSDLKILYGDLQFSDGQNVTRIWQSGKYHFLKLYYGWMPPHPMTVMRISDIQKLDYFNCEYRIAADYDLMLRLIKLLKIRPHYINSVLVDMEDGGVSNSSLKNIILSNLEVLNSWRQSNGFLIPFWLVFTKPMLKVFQLKFMVHVKKYLRIVFF